MVDTPCCEVVWEYWLPIPFASFPYTSPPVRHRVPSHSERSITCNVTDDSVLHRIQTLVQSIPLCLLDIKSARMWSYLFPPNTELRNAWSHNYIPTYVFMAWCLVKNTDFHLFCDSVFIQRSVLTINQVWCASIYVCYKIRQ